MCLLFREDIAEIDETHGDAWRNEAIAEARL